jgi:hypothetical protein
MRHTLLALCLCTLATTAVRAADPPPPPMWPVDQFKALLAFPEPTPESRAATARLIRDLTSENFATREAASKELAAKGPAAFPGLREAVAASTDAELFARTNDYFKSGTIRNPPSLPPTTIALLRQYEESRAKYIDLHSKRPSWSNCDVFTFIRGLSGGQAEQFYQIVTAQETNPQIRAELDKITHDRAPERARLAIAQGQLDEAEHILRSNMPYWGADYAALLALRRAQTLDPEKEAAELGLDEPATKRMTMLLYRTKGEFGQAARFTEPGIDATAFTWRIPLIEAGRYAELARLVESLPNRTSYDLDHVTAYLLAGEYARANAILNAAIEKEGAAAFGGNAIRLLTQNDRAEDAITLAQRSEDPQGYAFHLLCARLQIRDALTSIKDRKNASMQFPEQLVKLGLPSAARDLLKDMQPVDPAEVQFSFRSYFHYAGQLDLAGQLDEAATWRRRGCESLNPAASERFTLESLLQQARDALAKLGPDRTTPASDELRQKVNTAESRTHDLHMRLDNVPFIGDSALPDFAAQMEASFWFNDILRCEPPDTQARYDKAIRIVQGKLSDKELSSLIDDLVRETIPDYGWDYQARKLSYAVVRFHATNLDQWAAELVRRLVAQRGDPSFWSVLGDLELMRDHPAQAVPYYQRAAVMNLTDATLMYRLGLAIQRADKTDGRGRQLMDYAPFLVLANYDQAVALADTMRRFQGDAVPDAWFGPFTRRFSIMGESYLGNSLVIACNAAEARGDFAAAFDLKMKMLFSNPYPRDSRYIVPVMYMANVADYHRLRALDAWSRKDFPTLADALWRQMDNGPPDPALLEKTLPALRAADAPAAQKVLTRAIDRLKPVVEDYPDATRYKDQLTRLQSLAK